MFIRGISSLGEFLRSGTGEGGGAASVEINPPEGGEQTLNLETEAEPSEPLTQVIEPSEPAKPSIPAWANTRINQVTAQKYQAEARVLELERQLAAYQAGQTQPTAQTPQATQPAGTYTEAQLNSAAMQRAAELRFNEECNNIAAKGQEQFPDFADTVKNYGMLGGLTQPFMEAALAQDDPARVIYELGKDPDKAQSIMAMSPARQGAALARFAAGLPTKAAARTTSAAPPPIAPTVGGSARPGGPVRLDDDTVSMADWIKARNKANAR